MYHLIRNYLANHALLDVAAEVALQVRQRLDLGKVVK